MWAVGDSLFAGSWVVDLREPAGDTLVDADGLRGHTHPAVLINFPDGVGGSLIQGSEGPTFEGGALEGTAPRLVHQVVCHDGVIACKTFGHRLPGVRVVLRPDSGCWPVVFQKLSNARITPGWT